MLSWILQWDLICHASGLGMQLIWIFHIDVQKYTIENKILNIHILNIIVWPLFSFFLKERFMHTYMNILLK